MRIVAHVAFILLFSLHARAAPPAVPTEDDDIGIGWKIGIVGAVATIALSGLVGAVSRQPVDTVVRDASPALASPLTPAVITAGVATVGVIAGLVLAAAAHDDGNASTR